MPADPSVVVFDVNQTVSDMSPLAGRFTDVGVPDHLMQLWFASILRDGFGLTAAGNSLEFTEIARGALRVLLTGQPLTRSLDEAVDYIVTGFTELPPHEDIAPGVRALREAGYRLVTLTNGTTKVSDRLFTEAGVRDDFERLMSVEQSGVWKPARGSYEYAARECGVAPAEMVLVAVHPWDIDGAARAGLQTAWLNREKGPYPAYLTPPVYTVESLPALAEALVTARGQ